LTKFVKTFKSLEVHAWTDSWCKEFMILIRTKIITNNLLIQTKIKNCQQATWAIIITVYIIRIIKKM